MGSTFFSSGFLPRRKGETLDQRHMDLAAGLQHKLEEIVLHVLKYWADQTRLSAMCFTGGVAHNSSLNGTILRSGLFDEVFIHPASHDAGAAEGAAIAAAYKLGAAPFEQPRLRSASLGPSLGEPDEIERTLNSWKTMVDYEHLTDVVETAAELLTDGAVLGWAQGCSEFGPRALGNRRWSLVVIATRLDLGPSRGLTSSFAGRPGACPMRGASLRALAPGQAVSR